MVDIGSGDGLAASFSIWGSACTVDIGSEDCLCACCFFKVWKRIAGGDGISA